MTENKRFIKKQERVHYIDDGENIFEWVIYDTSNNNKVIVYTDMEKEANICCNLLNELAEENEQSKMMIATLRNMVLDQEDLEKEINELKIKNDLLSDELEQAKAVINKKWNEYLKKKME